MEKLIVNMNNTPQRWVKLMLTFQNSVKSAFKMTFKDGQTARRVSHVMQTTIENNPTWFRMIVIKRGPTVYVLKTDFMQEVVLSGIDKEEQT